MPAKIPAVRAGAAAASSRGQQVECSVPPTASVPATTPEKHALELESALEFEVIQLSKDKENKQKKTTLLSNKLDFSGRKARIGIREELCINAAWHNPGTNRALTGDLRGIKRESATSAECRF